MRKPLLGALLLATSLPAAAPDEAWRMARENGVVVNDAFVRARKMLHAWLSAADARTLLLPDRVPGSLFGKWEGVPVYTPHNSGADNYPHLVITAFLTDRPLFDGRMAEMLRNEVRYTSVDGGKIPGNLRLDNHELGQVNFFGAGEYCKDGAVAVTELLGRTPWYYRMLDMTADFMSRAPVKTRWGNLPADGAELNGDVLQTLGRLIPMTGDARLLRWAEQIGDAYVEEILPRSNYLPAARYDFAKRRPSEIAGLGDHGNEAIVGLILLQAIENERGLPRGQSYRPALRKVLDRVLETANPDGFVYRGIRVDDLTPSNTWLTDCWGYIYSSMYAYYQSTGEEKYQQAVLRVLRNLAKYRDYDWTKPSNTVDDLADSIEGAIYLVAHEPVPEAVEWIDQAVKKMLPYQKPDGFIERWYGDGNWNRTLLLYALMKTQGCRLENWEPGVELGAVRDRGRLCITVHAARAWSGKVVLDYARHRREMNLGKNYARLNQWPEWYTVDENTLYTVQDADSGKEELRLGSELKTGYAVQLPARGTKRLRISLFVRRSKGVAPE